MRFLTIIFFTTLVIISPLTKAEVLMNDSTIYGIKLNDKISKISFHRDSSVWVIVGEKQNKIYKIKPNHKITDIVERYHLPKENHYSEIFFLKNGDVLLGTLNNYAFYIRNKSAIWLNQKYGLTDSVIHQIEWYKKEKFITLKTPQHLFAFHNYQFKRNFKFVSISDSIDNVSLIAHFIRHYLRKPIQKGICIAASDVDYSFRKSKFIQDETLTQIKSELQPGDIILKRDDYQLSNIGVPGFWKHSALYLGSLSAIDSCFANLPELNGQLPSLFIKENYPEFYEQIADKKDLIIEAIGEGVVVNQLAHIAKVDYFAALRANLSPADRFKSLITSFDYWGKAYDFLFDFSDDETVVCSELVYLSYMPAPDKQGIFFQMGQLGGKPFLSPNDIARQFATEYKTKAQMELVIFYDADEKNHQSERKTAADFARSWKRK